MDILILFYISFIGQNRHIRNNYNISLVLKNNFNQTQYIIHSYFRDRFNFCLELDLRCFLGISSSSETLSLSDCSYLSRVDFCRESLSSEWWWRFSMVFERCSISGSGDSDHLQFLPFSTSLPSSHFDLFLKKN